jgi:SAM-dependent methyltransferase
MEDFFTGYSQHYGQLNTEPNMALIEGRVELFRIREPWLPADPQARVLDVGCGWGLLLARLWVSGYHNISGVDVSEEMCAVARQNLPDEIRIACGDALEHLPALTEEFDLITMFDLLEHMTAPRGLELLQLCCGALRPGGSIVVRVPNMQNILATDLRYIDVTHVQGYGELSLTQLLGRAGFSGQRVIVPSYFRTDTWRRYRSWRHPFRGLGVREWLRYRANHVLHRLMYRLSYPDFQAARLTTFERFLTVQGWKSIGDADGE